MKNEKGPALKEKVFFWIVISLLSVFFAEVLSGSQPFALVTPWNPLVLMPLYGIHTLLLAALVFKGRPIFTSLFAAGCIFGLYEAYITKVLFEPPWGASPLRFLGVDLLWILILVLWWHAFFAFIIPLLTGEFLLTDSKEVLQAVPDRLKKIMTRRLGFMVLITVFTIWAALFMGGNMPAIWTAPVALAVNLAVLIAVIAIYRKKVGTGYSMRELLPKGKEFWVLFSILMAMYLIFGVIWSPERMPGPMGHLIILSLYVLFFILLIINIRTSKVRRGDQKKDIKWKIGWKVPLILFSVFTMISISIGITGVGIVFMILSFLMGIALGIVCLIRTLFITIEKGVNMI